MTDGLDFQNHTRTLRTWLDGGTVNDADLAAELHAWANHCDDLRGVPRRRSNPFELYTGPTWAVIVATVIREVRERRQQAEQYDGEPWAELRRTGEAALAEMVRLTPHLADTLAVLDPPPPATVLIGEMGEYEATCPNEECPAHGASFVHDDLDGGTENDDEVAHCPECETPLVKYPRPEIGGWTVADAAAAESEGWWISNDPDGFLEVQKVNGFIDDQHAADYVRRQAAQGSRLHTRALAVISAMEDVPVSALVEGDLVDLADDPYADPDGGSPSFPYELVKVYGLDIETPECTRVDFYDSDSVGFPPAHIVKRRVR